MLVTGTRVFPRLERIWGQATRGVLQDSTAVFNAFTRQREDQSLPVKSRYESSQRSLITFPSNRLQI